MIDLLVMMCGDLGVVVCCCCGGFAVCGFVVVYVVYVVGVRLLCVLVVGSVGLLLIVLCTLSL